MKWGDGEPFTAEDVRWTFQTVLDTENVLASYLEGVTKVEAVDAYLTTDGSWVRAVPAAGGRALGRSPR